MDMCSDLRNTGGGTRVLRAGAMTPNVLFLAALRNEVLTTFRTQVFTPDPVATLGKPEQVTKTLQCSI